MIGSLLLNFQHLQLHLQPKSNMMFSPTKYFTSQYPALLNGKEVGYGVLGETIYSSVELGFYGGTEQLTRRKFGLFECRTNGHFQAFSEIFHLDRLIPSLHEAPPPAYRRGGGVYANLGLSESHKSHKQAQLLGKRPEFLLGRFS